ncbi:MAG: hypothetical protein DRH04_10820 [Deltaproteobacteria bacterium]|nr:MAG: hypothetical protein DRH04_10820 [Deltaproteobacteria bacterium]
MANWKGLISKAAGGDKIIACTLTDTEMLVNFNCGYGRPEGRPFSAWSKKYVYFPVVYDGAEWVGRAPRNPCDEATDHVGGY